MESDLGKTKKGKPRKQMGRPVLLTEEKKDLIIRLCRIKPTLVDCQEIAGVDASTIEKWIRKEYDQTFSEFRDQRMAHTRFMIIRNILKQCEHGNTTMLIYASKNLCGWSDNPRDLEKLKESVDQLVIKYNEKKSENE
jgi:hypothetical protein